MLGIRLTIAVATVSCFAHSAMAAHFWLSTSGAGSAGPAVPDINQKVDALTTFYIWGRPTDGRQLDAISLSVVASTSDVDFEEGTYVFYNEIDGSTDRYELVRDSSTTPDLNSEFSPPIIALGFEDALRGINGVTLDDTDARRGIGPTCADGESDCVIAGDGAPAWLIASFGVRNLSVTPEVEFYLQVGDRGFVERELAAGDYDLDGSVKAADGLVWASSYGSTTSLAADGNGDRVINAADYTVWRDHLGDTATLLELADTDVVFGVDALGGDEPTYDSEDLLQRQITLHGDDADAVVEIVPAAAISVPEPTAIGMLAMALGQLISKRR